MTEPDKLNVACPYCKRQSRCGMTHECEALPENRRTVQIVRTHSGIAAIVFGTSQ